MIGADAAGQTRASAPLSRDPDAAAWTVVVPVKSLAAAKTRLAPELSADQRAALARAFALDTLEAVLGASRVARLVVVTDEPWVAGEFGDVVEVVPDPGAGLGAAIAAGLAARRTAGATRRAEPVVRTPDGRLGGSDTPDGVLTAPHRAVRGDTAVLLGDLPTLTPDDLDRALAAAARHPLAFVADADGVGTSLATATEGVALEPRFGDGSAARHRDAGFADLVAVEPDAVTARLRRDIDTAADLVAALALGVGPRTHAVAVETGLAARSPAAGS